MMVTNSSSFVRARAHSGTLNARPVRESSAARAAISRSGDAGATGVGPLNGGSIGREDELEAKVDCVERTGFSITSTSGIIAGNPQERNIVNRLESNI